MKSPAPMTIRTVALLVIASSLALGCSRRPRNHWWQFWRRGEPSAISDMDIAPGTQGFDGAPGTEGYQGSLSPDTLAFDPGTLAEPEPIRQDIEGLVNLATIYFDFDSFALTGAARSACEENARWISQHPDLNIRIEGHCDERGTEEYNYNLGLKRAQAVRETLVQMGCSEANLHTWSWGELRPLDPGQSESAWSQNRRVQFAVWAAE